jgi:hypothetical protein
MHSLRDVFFTNDPHQHFAFLNSDALTVESDAKLEEFHVEIRQLVAQLRRTRAESREIRARGRAIFDSLRKEHPHWYP